MKTRYFKAVMMLALAVAPALSHADEIGTGKTLFDHSCLICHGSGPYMAGTQQLRINYGNTKLALLEQRTDLTPAYIKLFVRRGYGVMPRFRKTEVSDADLAAISAYLTRNNPNPKAAK
jgi:mono/diheme cytochrome c family protein